MVPRATSQITTMASKTGGKRRVLLLLLRLLAVGPLLTSCDSFVITTSSSSRPTTPASTAVGHSPPPRQGGRRRPDNDECRRSRWHSSTSLILAAGDAEGVLVLPDDGGVVEEKEWREASTAAGAAVDDAVADLQSVTFSNLTRDQGRKMIDRSEGMCVSCPCLTMILFSSSYRHILEPDLLCDFLLELGACSASLVDADAGTDDEEPIFSDLLDPYQDTVNGWHNGRPYWNRCQVVAQFPQAVYAGLETTILPLLYEHGPVGWLGLTMERQGAVPNRDWVTHVQQNWRPLVVADTFLLTFPWHNDTDVAPYYDSANSNQHHEEEEECLSTQQQRAPQQAQKQPLIRLRLQGGVAFGTGEHATTQLCLEWLRDTLRSGATTTTTILDYGTGSGILGIAASLWAKALGLKNVTATGVDIDADAIHIANANAAMNGLTPSNMRSYLPPLDAAVDDESRSLLMRAHQQQQVMKNNKRRHDSAKADVVDDDDDEKQLIWKYGAGGEPERFDVVVANILAGPLIALAPVLANLCRGRIAMSGILPHQGAAVVEAYTNAGFTNVVVAKELNGWVLVTADEPQQQQS
jgi:ribosomal protein L11 methyltransferase